MAPASVHVSLVTLTADASMRKWLKCRIQQVAICQASQTADSTRSAKASASAECHVGGVGAQTGGGLCS